MPFEFHRCDAVWRRAGTYNFAGLTVPFSDSRKFWPARWHAHAKAAVSDRKPCDDRWADTIGTASKSLTEAIPKLSVLFVAPYPIEPPIHGGAVFMKQTLEELAPLADVHLAGFVETSSQLDAQATLAPFCSSIQFLVRKPLLRRNPATLLPHAVREFDDADLHWTLHRILYLHRVDVVQLEYTMLAQYAVSICIYPACCLSTMCSFNRWSAAFEAKHAPEPGLTISSSIFGRCIMKRSYCR